MAVLVSLAVLAVIAPLALVYLRSRSPLVWWTTFFLAAFALVVIIAITASSLKVWERTGVMLLHIIPLALLFLFMSSGFFENRRHLIAVFGPLIFIAGFFVALSCAVGFGMLQP